MAQLDGEQELTELQAEEMATMTCRCSEAVEYQKEKQRKEKTLKNVSTLFGEDASPEKRIGKGNVNIIRAAVEEICSGGLVKVTLNLQGELKSLFHRIAKAR